MGKLEFGKRIDKCFEWISLCLGTLIAYPTLAFLGIIPARMGLISMDVMLKLSSSIVCVGSIVVFWNMFKRFKIFNSILLSVLLLLICHLLAKLGVPYWLVYQ